MKILNKEIVSQSIHKAVNNNSITYIEAIVEYCSMNDIPLEDVKKLLDESVVSKLESEALELRLLTKTYRNKLDI